MVMRERSTQGIPLHHLSCQAPVSNTFTTKTCPDWQTDMYDKTKNISVPSTTSAQVKNLQVQAEIMLL